MDDGAGPGSQALPSVDRLLRAPGAATLTVVHTNLGRALMADRQAHGSAHRAAAGAGRSRRQLEYLDRLGLLRRVGDVYGMRTDSALFTDGG